VLLGFKEQYIKYIKEGKGHTSAGGEVRVVGTLWLPPVRRAAGSKSAKDQTKGNDQTRKEALSVK
jgi:hypothetical protein